ncbi:LutC/YkgG family protein [Aestuariirhabdus litorea]|uniref:Lactate utilization protein C n=1 Tax=Aestuariirhabdus litorea TaxID=2528527 RepID=A0A3P3VQV3_9GAMM|nr:lactate utilization protein C [Aestuariirhabdus litorea]RRJ83203.1 lactate utilization protein C [Aestuariirhabdus litorea]RWW93360.1 lactate utilization protein C [Endozoicomonadaceae bacterium GTF-13]
MSHRDRILNRLSSELAASGAEPLHREHEDRRVVTQRYQYDPQERVRRLTEMMQAVHTEVHSTDEHSWPQRLLELMQEKGLTNLLLGLATPHGQQLSSAWQGNDSTPQLEDAQRPIEALKEALFHRTDAALTGSRGGIAATGSIIVWPTPEEPRLISLVPPVHFVLLRASTIHNSFAEVMEQEQWKTALPTNALLISGPSKTADIQQTLAYGAHGPKELVVLLINDLDTP